MAAMPTRNCPDCKREMRELRHQDVVVDACDCGGMWFDRGELAAWRAAHATVQTVVAKPRTGPACRCPHCAGPSLGPVWLDRVSAASCSSCQGYWLPGTSVAMVGRGGRGATDSGAWLTALIEFVGNVVTGAML